MNFTSGWHRSCVIPVRTNKKNDKMKTIETTNGKMLNREETQFFRTGSPAGLPNQRLMIEPNAADPRPETVNEQPSQNGTTKKKSRRHQLFVGMAVLAAGLATGVYYLEYVAPYESTDDAFIAAHVTPVAPQVAGRVAQLFVKDNQEVKAGDLLLQIDPRDYQAALDQQRANLAAAQSRLQQADAQSVADQARIGQEKANVVAAEAQAK